MIVRIIKQHRGSRGNERVETDYSCETLRKIFWDDGVDVILYDIGGDPQKQIKLEMPRDGKQLFIMNAAYDTIDSITWPLNAKGGKRKINDVDVEQEIKTVEGSV